MGGLTLVAGEDSIVFNKDPKLGISAVRVKCRAENLFDALYAPCPDIGLDLVENQPRSGSRDKAGDYAGYEIIITLEGRDLKAEYGETWSIEGATSEDDIATHPDYAALLEFYGGTEDFNSGVPTWPKFGFGAATAMVNKLAEAANIRNPMHGVKSYLCPSLVLTRRYTADEIPADFERALGSIDTPPAPKNSRVIVRLSGRRNWLKVRARANDRGNTIELEESWMRSAADGFVKEMYPYR